MADGYSRVTGKVGVCAVVPGPGVLNAAAGLATAYACGSRVLCIVGQVPTADLGRGRGVLHELPDQHAVLDGVIGRSRARDESRRTSPALVDAVFTALVRQRATATRTRSQVGWDTMLRRTAAGWPSPPDAARAEAPDLALVRSSGRSLGARRAARDRRRRRRARRGRRPRRAGRAARRTRPHDDRGQGRDSRQPPARAARCWRCRRCSTTPTSC